MLALASTETTEQLRGSLAVVDAKSLYVQLCKETIGGSDMQQYEFRSVEKISRS